MLNAIIHTKDIRENIAGKNKLKGSRLIRLSMMVIFHRMKLLFRKDHSCTPFTGLMVNIRYFLHASIVTIALTIIAVLACCIPGIPNRTFFKELKSLYAAAKEELNPVALIGFKTQSGAEAIGFLALKDVYPGSYQAIHQIGDDLENSNLMKQYNEEGQYNKTLKLFNEMAQNTPPGSEQMYLAAVAYFRLRDYNNSFECMAAAVETCSDVQSLEAYSTTFSEIFTQDCKALMDAKADAHISSRLEKNRLLYQGLEQTFSLKKQKLQ